MKYVCMEEENGTEEIFTFPKIINHDVMAEALGRLKNQTWGNWQRVFRYPVSAGFIDCAGNCYGESETLGLQSRGDEDTKILNNQ